MVSEESADPRICKKNTSDLIAGISYSTVNETVLICNYLGAQCNHQQVKEMLTFRFRTLWFSLLWKVDSNGARSQRTDA